MAPPLLHKPGHGPPPPPPRPCFPHPSAPTTPPPSVADVAAADGTRSPRRQQRPHLADDGGHHHHQDAVMLRRTRSGRAFPPPISVIGRSGRPWLRLRAHREGGRLVLREMRLPSQELLQPCKEDGRFKLLVRTEGHGRCCGGGGTAGTAREG